jgi:hypothetical protein
MVRYPSSRDGFVTLTPPPPQPCSPAPWWGPSRLAGTLDAPETLPASPCLTVSFSVRVVGGVIQAGQGAAIQTPCHSWLRVSWFHSPIRVVYSYCTVCRAALEPVSPPITPQVSCGFLPLYRRCHVSQYATPLSHCRRCGQTLTAITGAQKPLPTRPQEFSHQHHHCHCHHYHHHCHHHHATTTTTVTTAGSACYFTDITLPVKWIRNLWSSAVRWNCWEAARKNLTFCSAPSPACPHCPWHQHHHPCCPYCLFSLGPWHSIPPGDSMMPQHSTLPPTIRQYIPPLVSRLPSLLPILSSSLFSHYRCSNHRHTCPSPSPPPTSPFNKTCLCACIVGSNTQANVFPPLVL